MTETRSRSCHKTRSRVLRSPHLAIAESLNNSQTTCQISRQVDSQNHCQPSGQVNRQKNVSSSVR